MNDYHLSRNFFMGHKYSQDNRLIFHKKLLNPINIDKWKCLSQFKIQGYRCWKSPFLDKCIKSNENSDNDFQININFENTEYSILIPSYVLMFTNVEKIINDIISIIKKTVDINFDFFCLDENVFHFKIISKNTTICFGLMFYIMFGFKHSFIYDSNSKENIFFSPKSYKNNKNDHVGISINFGYNGMMNSRYELIGILSCKNTSLMSHFDFNVIDKPMFMNIKCETICEIEVRFIDLSHGQILEYIDNSPEQEILVSLAFSEI